MPEDCESSMPPFDRFIHTLVPIDSSIFSLGIQHIIVVDKDGQMFSCGSNDEHQLGISENEIARPVLSPVTELNIEQRIIKVGTSDTCSFVLFENRTIFGFGTLRV